VHLTLWHADEREAAAVQDGWGLNLSAAHFFGDTWYPFLRAGYADDGGTILKRSVSAGFGHYMRGRSDLLGFGLNWGEPADSFGPALRDQYTVELFYRVQLSENFAITPDLQYVIDPALNPAEDAILYFGLRGRLSL
jgi:porin